MEVAPTVVAKVALLTEVLFPGSPLLKSCHGKTAPLVRTRLTNALFPLRRSSLPVAIRTSKRVSADAQVEHRRNPDRMLRTKLRVLL
jgi:hypothetical protein